MLEPQRGERLASAVEELAAANHQAACSQLDQVCEGCIELKFAADIQNVELQPETPSRRLHPLCRFLRYWIGRINEKRDDLRFGSSSCSTSSRFGAISTPNWATPVTLPPGRLRLATRPSWTGSLPVSNTI